MPDQTEPKITSFTELHERLMALKQQVFMFRGHSDPTWKLVPKAGRTPYSSHDDLDLLESWTKRALAYYPLMPASAINRMTIAAHHGLPTRLLDWTYNPLVAAFFATIENRSTEAVIHCYRARCQLSDPTVPLEQIRQVVAYLPPSTSTRIVQQTGVFTYHPVPARPLDEMLNDGESLHRIVIDFSYRRKLCVELHHYGINYLSLFPDLDGVSAHFRWWVENKRELYPGEV